MRLYNRHFRVYLAAILASIFLSVTLQAEQLIKSDGYNIHYNAYNSSMLTPTVVSQYGIDRSSSLGVLTISILNESDKAVTGYLVGNAKNPISQLTTLDFKKITEGDSIYYIATFNFANKEHLTFDITVVPTGLKHKIKLNFSQQFFVE